MPPEKDGPEKRSRRPNRTSSWWYSEREGLWLGKVWMGVKADGSPDRRVVKRKTEPKVIARIRELEAQRDAGLAPQPGKVPRLADFAEYCMAEVFPLADLSESTIAGYRSQLKNWILPAFGGKRMDKVSAYDLETLYNQMKKEGLKPDSIRKCHAVISTIYAKAKARGTVTVNIADRVTPPRLSEGSQDHLTRRETRKVLGVVQEPGRRNSARWVVALLLGLRQGEALGLRWQYLWVVCVGCGEELRLTEWWADGDDGCPECGADVLVEARVWWQVQRRKWRHGCDDIAECTKGKHNRACPKNCDVRQQPHRGRHKCVPKDAKNLCEKGCQEHASTCPEKTGGGLVFTEVKERRRKTISVPDELVPLLTAQHKAQATERLRWANLYEDHDLVFAQPNGRPIDYRRDWAEWKEILQEAGVADHRVHAARHTAATQLLSLGVEPDVVRQLLGHSDLRTTMRYTHTSRGRMAAGAARVGKAMLGG